MFLTWMSKSILLVQLAGRSLVYSDNEINSSSDLKLPSVHID